MSAFAYQPYYCEENIWQLCGRDELPSERKVIIISNETKSCAMWGARAASRPEDPIIWDYHVILAARDDAGWAIWDLDTVFGCPLPVALYLRASFNPHVNAAYRPRFRVVEASLFHQHFASDRRHMRDKQGNWLAPPPTWPAIGATHNLPHWIDMTTPFHGTLTNPDGLLSTLEL